MASTRSAKCFAAASYISFIVCPCGTERGSAARRRLSSPRKAERTRPRRSLDYRVVQSRLHYGGEADEVSEDVAVVLALDLKLLRVVQGVKHLVVQVLDGVAAVE